MIWIERVLAAIAEFIACDLFKLDSRDIERVRERERGRAPVHRTAPQDSQVVYRLGR